MRHLASIIGALALTAALVIARPSNVDAHAEYDHSEPAEGATVATPPTLVKVWFTESVQLSGSSLQVQNASGQQVDNKDTKLDPSDPDHKIMTVSLPANLPAGTYKVLWKTTSAEDGDTDEDDFSFTVRAATAAAPAAQPSPAAKPAAPAAPAAAPAAQPSPAAKPAVPAQAPRPAASPAPAGLPRTGEAAPVNPLPWLALGSLLLLGGLVVLRRMRAD